MLFTIIIPVRKSGNIDKPINSIKKINYPENKIEIIVSYGNQPSAQRNRAVKQACGELIYFLDNDSEATPELFNIILKHFEDPKVAVVGGPNLTPESDTLIQRCFGMGLASKFANGKVSARYRGFGKARESDEKELILCNFCMRKNIYTDMGGLNEKIYPNEENELMNRLKDNGYKLIYDPDAYIYRSRRKDFKALIKQHLNYGRGRMEQTFIEGFSMQTISFFIPLGFLCYLIILPFLPKALLYYLPISVYMIFTLISALGWSFKNKNMLILFIIPFVYLLMHISYASGIIWGFFRQKVKHTKPVKPDIEVVKLKEFNIS